MHVRIGMVERSTVQCNHYKCTTQKRERKTRKSCELLAFLAFTKNTISLLVVEGMFDYYNDVEYTVTDARRPTPCSGLIPHSHRSSCYKLDDSCMQLATIRQKQIKTIKKL